MASVLKTAPLPATMENKLRAIRRRLVLLASLRAVAWGVAVLISAMLVAMTLDWWLTFFSTSVRLTLTTLSLLLAAIMLLVTGARPLREAFGFARAASDADGEVPQLEERWTTVASFAVSEHQPTSATARAMLQQVTSEAVALGQLVRPAQVAKPAAIKPAVLGLLGSCALLAGFLAMNWEQTSVLLQRFWSPLQNITATQLNSRTGDREVPRGELLNLIIDQSGLQRDAARLEVTGRDGILDVFEIEPDAELSGAFAYGLPVDNSFRYRVLAGDGQTPWHRVTAIDYPELAEVRLKVIPPDYVARPPYEKSVIPNRVKVVQGSQLELLMKPADQLERLVLQLKTLEREADGRERSGERELVLEPQADGWYRFDTQLVEDFSLSPSLLNRHGLLNEDKRVCRFQVIADKAPVARIVAPTDEMAVAVDDVIDIRFDAHDDFGIATAELVVYDESETEEGGEPKILAVQEIDLGDQQLARHVTGSTQLDLQELGLPEGTNISYAIRVTDNRDLQLDPEAVAARRALAQREQEEPGESSSADSPTSGRDAEERLMADASDAQAGKRQTKTEPAESGTGEPNPQQADSSHSDPSAEPTDAAQVNSPAGESNGKEINEAGDAPAAQVGETSSETAVTAVEPNDLPTDTKNAPHAESDSDTKSASDGSPESNTRKPPGQTTSDSRNVSASESSANPREDVSDTKDREVAAAELTGNDAEKPDPHNPSNAVSSSTKSSQQSESSSKESPDTQPNGTSPLQSDDTNRPADEAREPDSREPDSGSNNSGGTPSNRSQKGRQNEEQDVPRQQTLAMNPQQSTSGQNAETGRRRLRITERLLAISEAATGRSENLQIRDRVVQIDEMLKAVEEALVRVVDRNIPDADRAEQFRRLDSQLGDIESYVAELRDETQEQQFAFVGLQMVHIATTHVTPARDRIFAAIRKPLGTDNPKVALHHIVRAREMLAALLARYERVARERALADAIDESVEMYEVYVEKMQSLMREARQNRNPLQRKMAIIEVDQDYLDRYAEVETLRREMMAEFGRMLGDDPRLLARYLDLLRRRRSSLRDRLTELAERQDEITTELSGWLQVGEAQREDLWSIVAELRLHSATSLAKEADGLQERVQQSLPLSLNPDEGTAGLVLQQAGEVARVARDITFDIRKVLKSGSTTDAPQLAASAEQLVVLFGELDAALDQLGFEHEDEDEVTDYVSRRLLESRTVADQAVAWARVARHLEHKSYAGLAETDQQRVAIATELLRVEMLDIEGDLSNQFQQVAETDVPGPIIDMIRELHRTMEAITIHQNSAAFALTQNRLEAAETQEFKALDAFDRAEKLLDKIRRAVVTELDQYEVDDPNIADLEDPTLDRFLERLEREPNIEALLGIPNRPRNLRVLADSMLFQQGGSGGLGDSSAAARQRARQAMQMQLAKARQQNEQQEQPQKPDAELTEEEREQRERAQRMQEMLEESLASVREKLDEPQTTPEQRRRLEQMAENMQRMLDQQSSQNSAAQEWERIVESDTAKETLRALAAGQRLPDDQWNKLLSTLDDGLWQVRGRTPPEDYRKAIEQYQDRVRKLIGGSVDGP